MKKAFLLGAIIGDGIAVLFGLLDWLHPHFWNLGALADRTMFKVCPFYVLGMTDWVHSWVEVVAIALIGNAILYGVLALVILLVWRLIRWIASRQKAEPSPMGQSSR